VAFAGFFEDEAAPFARLTEADLTGDDALDDGDFLTFDAGAATVLEEGIAAFFTTADFSPALSFFLVIL
jgi:hypothetical protein